MSMLSRAVRRLAHGLAGPSTQKLYRARVNTLLFGADRLLLTPRTDTLQTFLMTRLSDDTFYNTYRSTAFMRLIRFCLQRHLFDVALALHDRMRKEGFLAVHALALRITALDIVRRATRLGETAAPLKKLFEHDAYDIPAFMDLLHYLTDDKRTPGALVDDLAGAFISIRRLELSEYPDLVGELAGINMRAGRLEAAQKWLRAFETACGAQGVSPDVAPYSEVISTLHDMGSQNTDAIQDVLVRMQSAGVSPDANVFNALMRANFVQQRYREAFALYHVLMAKRSDALMPNDVTYKMLFRATNLLDHPRVARRQGRPDNAVPPRKLFREMLSCHLEQTQGRPLARSTVVSVSAFHLALRTFIAREDYAAAFVLLHVLPVFGFQPNLQTYLIVLVPLLERMKREVRLPRPEGAYRLGDFLAHLRPGEDPDLPTIVDRIRRHETAFDRPGSSPVGTDTLSHLLALGDAALGTTDDLARIPALPRSSFPATRRPRQVPSVAMLTGAEEPVDGRALFSTVPLARIVFKMLLGELFRKGVHRGDWDWKGAAGPIVEETGGEMVPEGIVEEEVGEGERERRQEVLPFAAARMRRRRRGARGGRAVLLDLED